MQVVDIRHSWPEKSGFIINRPKGLHEYTFLHFFNSVDILISGKIIKAEPHACIIYDVNTPQWFRSNGPLNHDWMHMTGNVKAELTDFEIETDIVYYPISNQFITSIMREMEIEFFSKRINSDKLIKVKTDELFIKFARACSKCDSATNVKLSTESVFRDFRSDMMSQLGENWNVAAMAKSLNLSQSRFYNVYKTLFGISPVDDLIHARIDSAKNYLSGTSMSLSEISESLGYKNITHFSRQFKQITGITPGQYRKAVFTK